MDNYTNKKDNKQMMSEPEYFKIRPPIRKKIRFTSQVREKKVLYSIKKQKCFFIESKNIVSTFKSIYLISSVDEDT